MRFPVRRTASHRVVESIAPREIGELMATQAEALEERDSAPVSMKELDREARGHAGSTKTLSSKIRDQRAALAAARDGNAFVLDGHLMNPDQVRVAPVDTGQLRPSITREDPGE